MKTIKVITVCLALILSASNLNAQSKTKAFNYKKGEVLDILLFTGTEDFAKFFPKYRETAFTFALKNGYQPQPLLAVSETTQGGLQPQSFVFGKWKDLASRTTFLKEITNEVPDFHDQRRAIWSNFYLSYYELDKDVTFEITEDKIFVATALWKDDNSDYETYTSNWQKLIKKHGGKILLELTEPKSTVGYMYKPDEVILTEWQDKASFEAFHKENLDMGEEGIININEFLIK